MGPAKQGLISPDALAGIQRHLHLIMDLELAPLQRPSQIFCQLPPVSNRCTDVGIVKTDRFEKPMLGVIHGKVGIVDQFVRRLGIVRPDRRPEARANDAVHCPYFDRTGENALYPFRKRQDFILVAERLDGCEFVAAEAGDEFIIAQDLLHAPGQDAQNLVTRSMAKGVVDFLEAVQIDPDHRQLLAGVQIPIEISGKLSLEARAVRQARECVMRGNMVQLPPGYRSHVVVDQEARQPGADNQQGNNGNRQRKRKGSTAIDLREILRHRDDPQRGHAGEMQAYDPGHHQGNGNPIPTRAQVGAPDQGDRGSGQGHRQKDGRDDVAEVPLDEPCDPVGEHPGVMHGRK